MDIVLDVLKLAPEQSGRMTKARRKSVDIQTGPAFALGPGVVHSGNTLDRIQQNQKTIRTGVKSNSGTREAMSNLETVLATKLVESMIPKDQERLYGGGSAGRIWQGLHVELMGKSLGESGVMNIMKEEPGALADSVPKGKWPGIVPFVVGASDK
jgi:hypothetical protein